MTLQQLKYIVELDLTRNFTRAAESCNVSQPALTIQIKKLEEEIGIKIFDRTKVPVSVTSTGEELIAKAKKVLKQVDDIKNCVIDRKDLLEGDLTVGFIATLFPYLVPLSTVALRQSMPKVRFSIKEASSLELIDRLENGNLDIAVMATPLCRQGLLEFPIFKERFIGYAHPSSEIHDSPVLVLSQKYKKELLLLQKECCYNAQLLDICNLKKDKPRNRSFEYDITTIETLKNLARENLGIAIIPELAVDEDIDMDYLIHFPAPYPAREISLVVHENYYKKRILEMMRKTIWECLPDSVRNEFPFKTIRWHDSPYFRRMTA